MKRASILALVIALAVASPGVGEPVLTPPRTADAIEAAKAAIEEQRYEDAGALLTTVLAADADDTEALFLLGTIASRREDWPAAIRHFRRILDAHPELVRARLDYARALYENREDEEADYNFRLVLPHVPPTAASNIFAFLDAINARKRFVYSLFLGAAPDSNVNAATTLSELTLFGLPFDLSGNARAKSGVGIFVSGGGEYRQPLGDALRLRLAGAFYRDSIIGHADFDDMILRAYGGPQLIFAKGDASLLAVATKRWFADDPYSWSYGPRAEFNYALGTSLYMQTSLDYAPIWYHANAFQNGHVLTGLVTASYALSPASYLSFITGIAKEHAASPDYSNLAYRIGVGYQRELPYGITAYLQPDATLAYYTAPSPVFATTRRDRILRLELTLTKRDIRIAGFSPSITYDYTRDVSNQPLFSFERHQLLIGMSKQF